MNNNKEKYKKNKINFIIPDFMNGGGSIYLLDTFRSHKEIFKDNVNILGFIGQFNGCAWNKKNKAFDVYRLNFERLKNLKNAYKKVNVLLVILFDKEEITMRDLDDEYSNKVMEIFNDSNIYVLCKSKKLITHIRKNYTNIKIIDYYETDLQADYILVDPIFNKNNSLFNFCNKSKLIMIPDAGCIPNKKNLFHHSKKEGVLCKLNTKREKYYSSKNENSFFQIKKNPNYLTYDNLIEYSKKGINTFLLSGLGVYNYAMYENIVDYLFKDDSKKDQIIKLSKYMTEYIQLEMKEVYSYRL